MIDLILTGGYVVTMNSQREIIEDGAVAIDKGRLLEVGPSDIVCKKYEAKEVRDCKDHVILPGLVDAHGHGGHGLLKGVGCGNDSKWMSMMTDTYMHYTTDDFWYYEGKLSALERMKSGITTGVSVMGSTPRCDSPVIARNHAKAYAEVGIREIVCAGPCNPPWPHKFSRWVDGKRIEKEVSFDEVMEAVEEVIATLNHTNDDKTRAFVAPFVIVTGVFPSGATAADLIYGLTDHDYLQARRLREIAAKYKTRIHSDAFGGMIHMAVEDKKNALLGPDVHLQHCTGLSMDEVKILAETGTSVSCSPWNEYVRERTPIIEMMEMGTTVAIGSDGTAPNVTFDLFQAMRKTQTLHQVALGDYYLLPPEKLLEMVTIDAAKCVGWDDELGSLEAGKKADVITINMKQPHLAPMNKNMYIDRLVYSVVAKDVEDVIVDGQFVMKGRRALLVDEDKIIDEANAESQETIERAGLVPFTKPQHTSWGKTKAYIGVPYNGQ